MHPKTLAALGFKIFPCNANGKEPCIARWQQNASDVVYVIEGWMAQFPGCNWAVATGPSNLVVLDADKKHGGLGTLLTLELNPKTPLPSGFSVNTPGGGCHLYYRGQTRGRVGMKKGIDIRSDGNYVLVSGSINGVKYESRIGEIPMCPQWLLDMAGAPRRERNDASAISEPDRPSALENAEIYLRHADPAREGCGGDMHTFRVACHVRDLGLSEETCADFMMRYWNDRCEPPWSAEGIAAKVHNAFRYAENDHGSKSKESRDAEAATIFPNIRKDSIFLGWNDIGNHRPEQTWIVNGWIPFEKGLSGMLTGEGGTGKSLLAIQLAAAVAGGDCWLGFPTVKMPTFYISCEDSINQLNMRFFDMKRALFLPDDNRECQTASRQGLDNVICQEIAREIKQGPFWNVLDSDLENFDPAHREKLIILDTIPDFFSGNENDRSSVSIFIKHILGSLAMKHNATLLLVAHPSKSGKDSYSGSTAWLGSVRFLLFLSWLDKDDKSGARVLSVEKSNYAMAGSKLLLNYNAGVLLQSDIRMADVVFEDSLLELIQTAAESKHPYGVTTKHPRHIKTISIKERGKKATASRISDVITKLIDEGKIENRVGASRGNGLYLVNENDENETDESQENETDESRSDE